VFPDGHISNGETQQKGIDIPIINEAGSGPGTFAKEILVYRRYTVYTIMRVAAPTATET
jgi:hypothetical protein